VKEARSKWGGGNFQSAYKALPEASALRTIILILSIPAASPNPMKGAIIPTARGHDGLLDNPPAAENRRRGPTAEAGPGLLGINIKP